MTAIPGAQGFTPRVLHGCYEVAGQGLILARSLARRGCEARSFSYHVDWDGRVSDLVYELGSSGAGIATAGKRLRAFLDVAPRFDLFHFHFGSTLLPRHLDLPLLTAMGKRIVFHFHGCEIRDRRGMLERHLLSTCTDCDPFCRPAHQARLRELAKRYAHRVFYSTLDLSESVPGGEPLPLVIELEEWQAAARAHGRAGALGDGVQGPVVIAHAPTNRLIKGTRYVLESLEALRREFPRLELRLIERVPWREMPATLAGCDILVDQLMMGWYGLLAIEGMAEGKPVVGHIRPDLAERAPDCPVVDATPATLTEVLRRLIRYPEERRRLGSLGPEFVRRHHDADAVAGRLLEIYRSLFAPGTGSAADPDARP